MPGKHAPDSARSYYLSLGRSVGGALAAVGVIVALVLVVLGNGGDSRAGSPAIDSSRPSPSPTASDSSTPTPAPAPSPTPTILPPNRVTVAVFNGTRRNGLAQRTADRIKEAGYPVVSVGNNSAQEETSTIFYRPDARAEALEFQRKFPEFTVLKESTRLGNAILRAVIGADYP